MHALSHLSPETLESCAAHAQEVANHLTNRIAVCRDKREVRDLEAQREVEQAAANRYKAALALL